MARIVWGKVYLNDVYAGRLQEEPGGRCTFTYDETYRNQGGPAIAHSLPLRAQPFRSERGLHPFFDNLVAEGWLRSVQARALEVDPRNGLALLLGFGHDLAGAVSIEDPEPEERRPPNPDDEATAAAVRGKASLSGIQRKLLVVADGKTFRPTLPGELSTHIAKLPSGNLASLLEVEYLTTQAVRTLLPGEEVVDMAIAHLDTIGEDALIIPRFDRTLDPKHLKRIHFEEFNQLLSRYSGTGKYDGTYESMGEFILQTPGCIPTEAYRLMRRIFACLLVGNTDAHFKNFAMYHRRDGLRLAPAYDLVSASHYPEYQTIALGLAGASDVTIGALKPKHLLKMGKGFCESDEVVVDAIEQLGERLEHALAALDESDVGSKLLRTNLQRKLEKRWKGSFALTGQLSSKRRSKGEKLKG